MSREKNESIISLCVYTTPGAEDLVSALLESIFQTSPSIWSDKETKESIVTVYLERQVITDSEKEILGIY